MLTKISLALMLLCSLVWAQNPNPSSFPVAIVTDQKLQVATNQASAILTGIIGPVDTIINVNSTAGIVVPSIAYIDTEFISVCSKSSTSFTVCSGGRGFEGTTATTHTASTFMYFLITAWFHNQMAAEMKAVETSLFNLTSDTNITGSVATGNLVLGWAGTLSVARGGNGTGAPALVAGTNITLGGTWPNYTINSTASGGGSASCQTATGSGTASISPVFTTTVNCQAFSFTTAATVNLPTFPSGTPSGTYIYQMTNTTPTANPLTYTGTTVNFCQPEFLAGAGALTTLTFVLTAGPTMTQTACSSSAAPVSGVPNMNGTLGAPTVATRNQILASGTAACLGTANAQTIALSPAPTLPTDNSHTLTFSCLPNSTNSSTTPTMLINSIGSPITIVRTSGALQVGDYATTRWANYRYEYNSGTPQIVLENPINSGGSIPNFPIVDFAPWGPTTSGGNATLTGGATGTLYVWALPPIPTGASMGVFALNAQTGALHWAAAIYSINGSSSAPLAQSSVGVGCGGCLNTVTLSYRFLNTTSYYLGVCADANLTYGYVTANVAAGFTGVGVSNIPVGTAANSCTWSGGAVTFPSTTSTITATGQQYPVSKLLN